MIEELKALAEELCDSLEAEVKDRWGYDERLKRQLDRNMEVVIRARNTLPKFLSALEAVPVMKEALGNAYETLSIIADAADEDQVKLAAREATTGISQALAALEPKP